MAVNHDILKRRVTQEKKGGSDRKIYIGDFRPNNLDQLGCKCYDPNRDEVCNAVIMMYDKALDGMVDSFCTNHGYFVNSNRTKIILKT